MKRRIIICVAVLLAVSCCIIVFAMKSSKIVGYDGVIAKARKEIKNIAEIDTLEMVIAGKSTVDRKNHLFWFITGNQYQMHRYIPMEFTELENNEYKFVHKYNGLQRGQDIFVQEWKGGYSFIVNNPKCKSISIWGYKGETQVTVNEVPFVYYYPLLPGEYAFYDKDGNEVR